MRILLAHNSTYYPAHGGGDKSNRLLMEALAAHGHLCRVVARTEHFGPDQEEKFVRDAADRGVFPTFRGEGVVVFSLGSVEVHTAANLPNLRAYFSSQIEAFPPDMIITS